MLNEMVLCEELFHTPSGVAFADFITEGHRETWPIRSKRFRTWLRRCYYHATGSAPSAAAIRSALDLLEARAQFDGPERIVHTRVAEHGGRLYLDLADEHWRAVAIGPDGKYRMLNVLDEFTHECLAIRVARKLKEIDVIDVLSDLFILRGVPAHIRSDNGPEFVAKAVQDWIAVVGAKTAYIERGSPWENGYIESFNARLRDKLLNGEIFYTLREAQIVIERWRRHYNHASHNTHLSM